MRGRRRRIHAAKDKEETGRKNERAHEKRGNKAQDGKKKPIRIKWVVIG